MVSRVALTSVVLATTALAQDSLEGIGRVTVLGGWRYTPNEGFYGSAATMGYPATARSKGGPLASATFAYSVADEVELGLDVFGTPETFRLQSLSPISATSYGVLVGVRLQRDFDFVVPYFGGLLGPTLIYVSSPGLGTKETLATGFGAAAGLNFRLAEHFGLAAEGKFILARGAVPQIGGVNGGGLWLGVGLTYYLAKAPQRDPSPF